MDRSVLMGMVLGLLVVLLALMVLGWRARQRRQSTIAAPPAPPDDTGNVIGVFSARYVATTISGEPLNRIAVHGLGFRSIASLTATDTGVLIERPGERLWWLEAANIHGVRRATWTIDRVVESDGLHVLEWALGDQSVDSYFRLDSPSRFDSALAKVLHRKASAS
ncbi:MAG: hypothetical protein LH471_01095 [Salinibacterium sp.]|nr:hypothetical protein [Salinibacterium sp.]